ncbi:MAG: AraC family transcriptional regulator [Cyanobacteria bacterium J06642_9]
MQVSFSATDIEAFYAEWGQRARVCSQIESFETTLNFPPQIGNGWLRRIKLRPGLEIVAACTELPELLTIEAPRSFEWQRIQFKSSLSGHVRGKDPGSQDELQIAPRQSGTSFFRDFGGGWYECQPHQPTLHVDVNVNLSALNDLVRDEIDQLPLDLQSVLAGKAQNAFSRFQRMSNAVLQAAEQILHCPYQGITRRLYLESRAIELIALQLQSDSADTGSQLSSTLRSDDVDRIHQAREILLSNLGDPPSLLELAQRVGLNDYKLKRGFRQVFGTTTFGCLYHYRMEQAKQLLEEDYSTVTEAAQAVGYTSVTSFSAAFKKKFGVPPRTYKRSELQ